MRRLIALSLTALLSTLANAWEIQPYSATYKFDIDGKLTGTATRTLQKTGTDAYHYEFAASAMLASANESSDFRFDGKTVTPVLYQQQSKVFMVGKTIRVDYDSKAMTAKALRKKKLSEYAIKPGTLDPLNLEIQVRRDLEDTGKLDGNYWLGDSKDLSPLKFEVQGEEVLNTPAGKLHTIKVKRQHKDPERHTTFWLAKELDYLPAKVVQDDDGAVYTIELIEYKPAAKAATK